MIYNNAVEQIKGMKPIINVGFRLAKVSSLSNGRAYVQFYGESTASGKLYPYIEGYKPTVGDDVLLVEQGSTFIIIGKVSRTNIVNNYNLTKAVADTLYLPIGTSPTVDRLTNSGKELVLNAVTLTPSENGTFYLGSASAKFKALFATQWLYDASHYIYWSESNRIIPNSNQSLKLGSSNNRFDDVWGSYIHGTRLYGPWYHNNDTASISWGTSGNYAQLTPSSTNTIDIGQSSSKQFRNVYAKQFYQNGTAISTSDRRKKTNIKDIAKKYIDFFKRLKPRSFRFKDGESGRTHTGFIAQEVEEAAAESGINNKDLAFICIDEEGNYGLRYEELIAIQTQVIQDLMARVERLENIVKERA
jgi:hypothetical protein